jgi:CubicO group peptidase (beta-lactamase class C family)
MPTKDFAKQYLMEPLGIADYVWLTDLRGDVWIGAGINASCRSLARLGQLYCNGGLWKGQRLLAEDFIAEATAPSGANAGYGFLWWLNRDAGAWQTAIGLKGSGKMIARAPENSFRAQGFFGQIILVVPDLNLVAVTMGTTLNIESLYINRQFWAALEPALPRVD